MNVMARSGDKLEYYSRLFDIPFQLILDSNNSDPSYLAAGEPIAIPGFVKIRYTVKAGDTIWSIATDRGLDLDAIVLVNQGIPLYRLQSGDEIYLPIRVTKLIVTGKQSYDYAALLHDISRLQAVYPFFGQRGIGHSVLGKDLREIIVGRGEKQIHFNASFHAREWITTPVLMTFLNHYLMALTNHRPIRGIDVTRYYDEVRLSLVPMVNPDGVDLVIHGAEAAGSYENFVRMLNHGNHDFSAWKANIRGVDLNDQFPADWEIEAARREQKPAPSDYPGEYPLSEPEAKAVADLTEERDFYQVVALHTQGREIYWGYEGYEPPESSRFAEEYGRVSGYTPIRYVDSYAGFKDWFIQERRRPGFTVELGKGMSPLPLSRFDQIYQEALGIFLAALYM